MTSLDDVLARPADTQARLAHADAIEKTDRARSELIRIQCELASLAPSDARVPSLRMRSDALVEKHHGRWVKPLKPSAVWAWTERGFFETVRVKGKAFVEVGERMFDVEPIHALWSRDVGPKLVPAFAAKAVLARIDDLALPECKLDTKALRALLASPHLASLRRLGLARNSLRGADTGAVLAAWPGLASLERLDLSSNGRLRASDLEALFGAANARGLRELRLDGSLAGLDDMVDLARTLALPALRTLSLAGCRLEGEDLRVLRECAPLGTLEKLDVGGNPIDGLGLLAIAEGPWRASLQALVVGQGDDQRSQLDVLARPDALPALTSLAYRSQRLTAAGIEAVAGRGWALRKLELDGPVDADGIHALGRSPLAASLEVLRIRSQAGDSVALASAMLAHDWPRLVALEIGYAEVAPEVAARLCASERLPTLRALSMSVGSAPLPLPRVASDT